jgi:amino acid adenylation domain-containing protein
MTPNDIEAIYPLSPMQQGMLFHTLYTPGSSAYFEQQCLTLVGELDPAAFRAAWQATLARHPALRTLFVWEGRERPLQVVRRDVRLPWAEHDLRAMDAEAQAAHWDAWLAQDRARGFDLRRAPLMRVTLFRWGEARYRCVWSFHHLLLDGWSLTLVLREVFARYAALGGGPAFEPAPAPGYRAYIAWLQQQSAERAEAFWREHLAGFAAATPLNVDTAPSEAPAASDAAFEEQILELPEATTRALADAAREAQVTLNTLVQGAWAVLLSRYSGEDDVVFGATVAGRPPALPDVEAMVGLLINTLPVRARLDPPASFAAWARALQSQQAEARQFGYASLAEVQAWSEAPPGQALFATLLVFENYPDDVDLSGEGDLPAVPGLRVQDVRTLERTHYPLTVIVVPGARLALRLSYDTRRLSRDAVRRMRGHLRTLLAAIAAAPQTPIVRLPLLTEDERRQILVTWNATGSDYPRDATIPALFEAQVARTPDAVALVFGDQTLTYRELNRRANRLAHVLRRHGVGPEVGVGLCVERSPEMVVGTLAALKAGGAYVPLDPGYPPERLAFMVQDTQVPVLLTLTHLRDRLPPCDAHVLCLDGEGGIGDEDANPPATATADNLAYVMYTSGSTGRPKGAQIPHRAVVRLVKATNYARLDADQVLVQLAPISFDAATLELWGSLLNGGRLVIPPPGPLSFEALAEVLATHGVTLLWLTAGLFHQMVETQLDGLLRVRQLLAGGDVLSVAHVRRVLEQPWDGTLINGYGPTENTTFSCCYPMTAPEQVGTTVPIGRPIANTTVYVLDRHMRPVPVGVPGELYVGGDGLARGYHRRPALTAERFVPHPFAPNSHPGARLYRTGDLARYRPTGDLEFLGRLDTQVKVRGFRIEPGEIETALGQHPAVQAGVVVPHGERAGEKRLVAYVVPAPGAAREDLGDRLRDHLSAHLPAYMVPAAVVLLDALPLTPNGKVDRRALPAPDWGRTARDAAVAPRTPTEQALAQIWAEVLDVAAVGVHDDFFELGGHSLLATRVASRIYQAFEVRVPLRRLFEAPTVAELAPVVEAILLAEIEALSDADVERRLDAGV